MTRIFYMNRLVSLPHMKVLLSTLLIAFTVTFSRAQVGIGTTTPHASSQLEIQSTTKGLLTPRMTQAEREAIVSPAQGLLVFQTNNQSGFYYYSSAGWGRLTTTADTATPAGKSAYVANTSGSAIAVILGGSVVNLPNAHNLGDGFSMTGGNTILTVTHAGRYQISYKANTTASLLMSSRITLNGSPLSGSVSSSLVATNSFHSSVIADLPAGSTLQLQFAGMIGIATLAGDAYLSVVRLQ